MLRKPVPHASLAGPVVVDSYFRQSPERGTYVFTFSSPRGQMTLRGEYEFVKFVAVTYARRYRITHLHAHRTE